LKVSGRLKHYINAFGEELIIDNADKALAAACHHTNAVVKDYTAGPVYFSDEGNGGHEWLIEFENMPDDIDEFTHALDHELKVQNSDYDAKRYRDIALRMPVIRVMQTGTFDDWLRSKNKLGGQHKVPRLANDRGFLEDILEHARSRDQIRF
jgi:hypothetical protein